MNLLPDLRLTVSCALNVTGTSHGHADEALDRLERVLNGLNAQAPQPFSTRAQGAPLMFTMNTSMENGAMGALAVLQMLVLHLGQALQQHFGRDGDTLAFEGSATVGASMSGGPLDHHVNLGAIEGHRYTFVNSVLHDHHGEVAFPNVVAASFPRAVSPVQDVVDHDEREALRDEAGFERSMAKPTRRRP